MKGEYVTTNSIIERVLRKVPQYVKWQPEEIVEWIYEAIKKIGAKNYTSYATVVFNMEEKKCEIPKNIEDIIQIRYTLSNSTIQMKRVTSFSNTVFCYKVWRGYIEFDDVYNTLEMDVSYFPVDEEGQPMIEDISYMIEAVVQYIVYQLFEKLYIQDLISADKFQLMQNKWYEYCGNAKCTSLMPRVDEDLYIADELLRASPKMHRKYNTSYYTYPKVDLRDLNKLIRPLAP